jgi:putative sigma-54 modulation protein
MEPLAAEEMLMQLLISGRSFKVGEQLREHIDRRLQFALGKFDGEIERVEVSLSDANGPRGGVDKQCRIVVKMRTLGTLVVEDADVDFYAVVSRAADRIGRSVSRALDRRRTVKNSRRRLAQAETPEEEEET